MPKPKKPMPIRTAAFILSRITSKGRKAKRIVRHRKLNPWRIKFPWDKSEFQLHEERLERHRLDKENPNKKIKRLHIKFPQPPKQCNVGPGYPGFALVYANMAVARGDRPRRVLMRDENGKALIYEPLRTDLPRLVPDNVFEEYCRRIGIEPFNEEAVQEPKNAIDVKAFDLYWEDIRIERNKMVKEMKHLPQIDPIGIDHLGELEKSIYEVSRACYYSPIAIHHKSEDVLHLMIWFLNQRNIPVAFHIKVLQAVSLLVYMSPVFKEELIYCGGVRVLFRAMQIGQIICPLQACWACYALAMASIGSPSVIATIQKIPDFDETVGELTFPMFWYFWPTNFANILQSLIYGPGGVANSDEGFGFL